MNDDIKREIEQKAKEYYQQLDDDDLWETDIVKFYTAGATEFYLKGDKDGYNRAVSKARLFLQSLACDKRLSNPNKKSLHGKCRNSCTVCQGRKIINVITGKPPEGL